MDERAERTVFVVAKATRCGDCGEALEKGSCVALDEKERALCLACAELAHLAFLPSGDQALTRRAKARSARWAVVLQWSRSRRRYERQGLLVEPRALEKAEAECLADAGVRERNRVKDRARRDSLDKEFVTEFAFRIRGLFPACPPNTEKEIAEHACLKYSGRVGRSAMAKELDDKAIRLAVAAHIRHCETDYDVLLAQGVGRELARSRVRDKIQAVMDAWRVAGRTHAHVPRAVREDASVPYGVGESAGKPLILDF